MTKAVTEVNLKENSFGCNMEFTEREILLVRCGLALLLKTVSENKEKMFSESPKPEEVVSLLAKFLVKHE